MQTRPAAAVPPHAPRLLPMLATLAAVLACTDAGVEPRAREVQALDDRLTLRGRVCTAPPNPAGFPVKVVVVVDQSGSMCVSDPPGSQGGGFCDRPEITGLANGITEPARVRALRQLVQQFARQPNVQLSVVPFETNVKNVWPPQVTGRRFARPDGTLDAYVGALQGQLGKGTDYQGALAYAYGLIASDIVAVDASDPAQLPRTRYVVVFLTDGTPFPRCSANDDLTRYADSQQPDLTWADSSGAGDFCNTIDPQDPDAITGFVRGTDRNQNYQLFSYVRQLTELREQHNVGDVRLHTVLLFNEEAVRLCGPICQDLYGTYPNDGSGRSYPAIAREIARWTLRRLAELGSGTFQEFQDTAQIQALSLGTLDYSSFASRNVMKALLLQPLSSLPAGEGRAVDTDGDGVPDASDASFAVGTSPFERDSDGDCFDDGFEAARADQGFSPAAQRDARGCDPNSPLSLDCACRDTDGDGLSQYAEAYLGTRPGLVDSDGDGVPDGLEARWGLDPTAPDARALDTDGDGLADLAELRAGSHPLARDRTYFDQRGVQYETVRTEEANGSVCYDYAIRNVPLVTPPSRAGAQQGFNAFRLWFAEAPESGVATDHGVWRAACAWAQFAPPGVRAPAGPELALEPRHFQEPARTDEPAELLVNDRCAGVHP